tara:strand:- start:341 stop:1279 length:939 start_codon:yes stop_codon:yes gene_type:complete
MYILKVLAKQILNLFRLLSKEGSLKRKIEKLLFKLDSDIVAIDVGASYFPHTKWGLLKKLPSTLWIAIDPNEQNLSYIDKWKYKSKAIKISKAIGYKNGKSKFYLTKVDSGSSLLSIQINENSSHRVVKENLFPVIENEIEVNTLDKTIGKFLDKKASIIIKLDTQGSEFNIIKSFFKTNFFKNVLLIELENNILASPIYKGSSETYEILKFFNDNDFEVVHLNVVNSVYPESNGWLKSVNVPSECDWVFMKKFSSILKTDLKTKLNAIKTYINYNLYGEALHLIKHILGNDKISNKYREKLIEIKNILMPR